MKTDKENAPQNAQKIEQNEIIILGRANVGKSTLYNALIRERKAISSDIAGTTRDINKSSYQVGGFNALLLDSGGLEHDKSVLSQAILKTSMQAAKHASIILYVVDAKQGATDVDKRLFHELLRLKKPTALVLNKIESKKDRERALEFVSFGSPVVIEISAQERQGLGALSEFCENALKGLGADGGGVSDDDKSAKVNADSYDVSDDDKSDDKSYDKSAKDAKPLNIDSLDPNHIKIAICGRVNVGKSSLLNAILGFERSTVSSIAGTTIDPVNELLSYEGKTLEFVDTAGIRRRGKIEDLEFYALNRTQKQLQSAQIVLLVLDANEINELDERIAGLVSKQNPAVMIVLNKWDIYEDKERFDALCKALRLDKFKFLAHAPIISVSAVEKTRVHKLLDEILALHARYIQKIPTAQLNALVEKATQKHPLPAYKTRRARIYYATQYDIAPPRIALIMNQPKALHFSYARYLQNQLREEYELSGVPILLEVRKRGKEEE